MKTRLMKDNNLELLYFCLKELDIRLDEKAISGLIKYVELLAVWNTKVNLVSYKNPADLIILHIVDSLTLLKILNPDSPLKIMDIGTGAGLPGLILKIAVQSLEITLVEKNQKRVLFLKEVARTIGLEGVCIFNRDYNSLIDDKHGQKYDIVVSRAFSSKPSFFKNLTHFIRDSGSFIVMAGPSMAKQMIEIEGYSVTESWEGILPHSTVVRKLLKYSRR